MAIIAIFVIRRRKLKIAECAIEFTIVEVIRPVLKIFSKIGFSGQLRLRSFFLFEYHIRTAGCVETSRMWSRQRNRH